MTILSPQNTNLGLNGALHVCQLVQQKVRYTYVFAKPMTIALFWNDQCLETETLIYKK